RSVRPTRSAISRTVASGACATSSRTNPCDVRNAQAGRATISRELSRLVRRASLMRRLHRRPVRRDVGIAEIAVGDARAGERGSIRDQELVDPAIDRHRALPEEPEPYALPNERTGGERSP